MLRVDAVTDGAPVSDTVRTAFPSLDRLLGGGLRRGDLIVLGGDVGAGKSALALAVALRAAQRDEHAALFSGEMDVTRILERALAIEGRAAIDDLRRGALDDEARAAIGAAALRMRHCLPTIERTPASGVDALVDGIRALPTQALVVVDSLQTLPADRRQPQDEQMAHAVRRLKALAIDAHVALILTAHLPALVRDRHDLRPVLDDFGTLGAVKQHADVVLALYREELYERSNVSDGAAELAVIKNRNGPTNYIDLYFYKEWLRFEDMVDSEP